MSRIGKAPITLPQGVNITLENGIITVKGPKGELKQEINPKIKMEVKDNTITFSRENDDKEVRAMHGLYRALVNNMVIGVTEGYKKTVVVSGVGYKLAMQGDKCVMNIGFSHPVTFEAPNGVKLSTPDQSQIVVEGIDKCLVGQVASNIRSIKKAEPYHGYGFRYSDEVIQRKEGKSAGGKK